MEESPLDWSKSQREAYGFIRRAVDEGLSATYALGQFREGGGSIRNQWWYELYRETFANIGWRETIEELPDSYTISEKMYRQVDWDLREKYAVMGKVRGWSEELGQYIEKWVTVESDRPLTKGEFRGYMQQAIDDTIGSPDMEVEEVFEWDAVMR